MLPSVRARDRSAAGVENREAGTHISPKPSTITPLASFQETVLSDAPSILIYTTAVCPYCVAAKNFLKSKGQAWTEIRVDTDPAARETMIALTRRTSVPQIFIGDMHVGGYDDMIALHRAGGLEPLLTAGAA
jgi:glutaredoxin 3